MKCNSLPVFLLSLLVVAGWSCSQRSGDIASYPLDDTAGVIAQSGVTFDKDISADGKGSLRIEMSEPGTVPLFEVSGLKVDNARILYRAKVRTENVIGQVYLEMLVHFPDRGEFFSKGQATLLTGTNDWTTQETPFFLQKGEAPDLIKLNIIINGHGTVWVDDIHLARGPLK